jgi:phage head maturation protease
MSIEMVTRFLPVGDMDIRRVNRSQREVTAYAALFAQPAQIKDKHGHYWEQINQTAWNRALSHGIQRIQVHYNHGYDLSGRPNGTLTVPIATPSDITPDGRGLLTVSRYNDGDVADAVLAAWEGGQVKGQSFTGRVFQSRKLGRNGDLDLIERTELGLKEYGPTHSPAYEGDMLVAIRSQADLAELVRSMIADITGTPQDSPADSITPIPGPDALQDSSDDGHSRRIIARRNALTARRLVMGVKRNAEEPHA